MDSTATLLLPSMINPNQEVESFFNLITFPNLMLLGQEEEEEIHDAIKESLL
ncbi:hypothetical protein CCACVL1_03857 [Corchorus capsularis]|uniref:Uncharacterized protein n=1 Tax=Corchorus capsularis TaxID=210143 RepID=A0A1R3JWY1_COCAP|nr:hypothetical protein CCACVL1_03857 [Corchorus capsularis]